MKAIDDITDAADRQVKSRPWLDHLVRAYQRFSDQRGDFYAAGITYFTVLALFPLLMVAFSIAGFVLARNPSLLADAEREITEKVPGQTGEQLNDLIQQAIDSRTSVGVFGLAGALYAGLGWMSNLRAALTEQWDRPHPEADWWKTKLADLWALAGLGLAFAVSMGISAAGSGGISEQLLKWAGLDTLPGVDWVLKLASLLLGLAASWAIFTWVITRLPREPVTFVSAMRAGLLAAIVFEIFKLIAAVYLRSVLSSPAGAAFGPIIGIMVFSYMTYRIILFATAWAATAPENMAKAPVLPPKAVVIQPRIQAGTGRPPPAAGFAAGVLAALGFTWLWRARR